ncbi:MAG TPA: dienelactone hydrolase family protein [Nevskiaceae bacterium]|nr:dienelactone hydrolase family protein [Nevskiaceae bacterium]
MSEDDDVIVIDPPARASAAVIWLHGLGASGDDFVPIVPELGLPAGHGIRFVFPHAPVRAVTINGGMQMRAWYDITGLSRTALADRAGIEASQQLVEQLIAQQRAAGIASEKIVIAGFSQGGAIALHTATRHAEPLGGILALSTYLPLHESLAVEAASANRKIPIFMCHGTYDPVLPYALGEFSCAQLRAHGYEVDWRSYPMQHQVCMEEIEDIGRWLLQRLA